MVLKTGPTGMGFVKLKVQKATPKPTPLQIEHARFTSQFMRGRAGVTMQDAANAWNKYQRLKILRDERDRLKQRLMDKEGEMLRLELELDAAFRGEQVRYG